jgi:hypothetical protein
MKELDNQIKREINSVIFIIYYLITINLILDVINLIL